MDPTPDLSVLCPEEERAVPDLPAFYRDPVVDAGDMREIFKRNILPIHLFAIIEPDADMLQEILVTLHDPRHDIFDNVLLPPAPLLAALAALQAVLVVCQEHSPVEYSLRYVFVIF